VELLHLLPHECVKYLYFEQHLVSASITAALLVYIQLTEELKLKPHIVVEDTAVDIRFLLTLCKESAGNGLLWLMSHLTNSSSHVEVLPVKMNMPCSECFLFSPPQIVYSVIVISIHFIL
jgi:hypothetical protein